MRDEFNVLLKDSLDYFKNINEVWLFHNALAAYYDDRSLLNLSEEDTLERLLNVPEPGLLANQMMDVLSHIDEYLALHHRLVQFCNSKGMDPKAVIGIVKRGPLEDGDIPHTELQ